MNGEGYIIQSEVAKFLGWLRPFLLGHRKLVSQHPTLFGTKAKLVTMFEAYRDYQWKQDDFCATVNRFAEFHKCLTQAIPIRTDAEKNEFVSTAKRIMNWGGVLRGNTGALKSLKAKEPKQLQEYIEQVKRKLTPGVADTDDLEGWNAYMTSAFSKVYAALIPTLPIYDSRVGCALTCLIRAYRKERCLGRQIPPSLNLAVPGGYRRCSYPGLGNTRERARAYADANLKAAWLLEEMARVPGEFRHLDDARRVWAIQSALFMLGYKRLQVPKAGQTA